MYFKDLIKSLYADEYCSDIFMRSNFCRVIPVDEDDSIVYSTKLNNPLLIGNEACKWLNEHTKIASEDYDNADDDLRVVIEFFIEARIYLPATINEDVFFQRVNADYLSQFEKGKLFTDLDLRISESCNFGCPHCIAAEATFPRFMTEEVAIHCVDSFVALKRECDPSFSDLRIHFGNCEPLLKYDVIETVILYCEKQYPELKKQYSINTNLTLITKSMAEFFAKHNVDVNSSLDGPKTGNDQIRVYKNGSGTYDDIIQGFQTMADAGTPMQGISITLNDKNFSYVDEEFFQWCEKMGFISIGIDFDLLHSTILSNQDKADFLTKNWVKLKRRGIELHGTWMTPFFILSNKSAVRDAYAFCKASEGKNVSVDSLGRIFACGYSSHYLGSFETIRDDIKKGGSYYQFVQQHLCGNIQSDCSGCVIEAACIGQCEMTRSSADPDMLKLQCDFYRTVTDKMLIAQSILLKEEEE